MVGAIRDLPIPFVQTSLRKMVGRVWDLPFLTSYDPQGSSEGSLDPLGLYPIADQLATQLVPAVRERMQRIRFLTAIAVGSLTTEGLEGDPKRPASSPYLVWEWLVVEALVRVMGDDSRLWGVPGSLVTRIALGRQGYLEARTYLKTPRIFGFHGVYKRLAMHLGLVDAHLARGPNAEVLADAWARGLGYAGLAEAKKKLLCRWESAVRRSLQERPPRTNPGWRAGAWDELARAFAPHLSTGREKKTLRDFLHAEGEHGLNALPAIWELQADIEDRDYGEELLHKQLKQRRPEYRPLLDAVRAYETFARSLQDGFDILKAEAARSDTQGFAVPEIRRDRDFVKAVAGLDRKFVAAYAALGEVGGAGLSLQDLFLNRFQVFAEPMDPGQCALALCDHHEAIQKAKSTEGKRPWFDRLGQDRIYVRLAYRGPRPEKLHPDLYVHGYRGWPIRRFYFDLT